MTGNLKIEWVDAEGDAVRAPDPAYPDGKDEIDNDQALRQCMIALPYPAPRCGLWVVTCGRCRRSVHITASGLADDPRSISVACDPVKEPVR